MARHYKLEIHELPELDDLLCLHERRPRRYPFLAESAAHGTPQGRFDILFAFPGRWLRLPPAGRPCGSAGQRPDFLDSLDNWWAKERAEVGLAEQVWPFRGGWFVYLGYELASQVEPVLQLQDYPGMPAAFACRIPAAVIRDRVSGRSIFLAEAGSGIDVGAVLEDVRRCVTPSPQANILASEIAEAPPEPYLEAVLRAKEYIRAGDIFQANLARSWRAQLADGVHAGELYRRLRRSNPGPFCGLVEWDDWSIVSSSPERLLRIDAGKAETRPIAGTRPRSERAELDRALTLELIAHPKERAEHVMLIDLERNDLGRICVPGTVVVNESMVIETYAHVHHIVSNIEGRVRETVTPGQAIRAVFPGGTITGCPKVRCMQIIAELEAGPRGPYTGSIGYLNRDGSFDLNILIRTFVRHGRTVSFSAGAGIVADSDPEQELEETRSKARGLIRALDRIEA